MEIKIDMGKITKGSLMIADVHKRNRKYVSLAVRSAGRRRNKKFIRLIADNWGVSVPTIHNLLNEKPFSPSNIVVIKLRLCGINITNVSIEENGGLFYLDVLCVVNDIKPTEFCKTLGIDYYNSYNKWRNKLTSPSDKTIGIIADYFAIDMVLLKTEMVNYYGYSKHRRTGVQVPKVSKRDRYGYYEKKQAGILGITPYGNTAIRRHETLI